MAAFDITKQVDESGRDVEIALKPQAGFIQYPPPFKFKITPRGQKQVDLIRALEAQNLWDESDAQRLEGLPKGFDV